MDMFKKNRKNYVWKFLVLQLGFIVVSGGDDSCRFTANKDITPWLQNDGSLVFPSYIQGDDEEVVLEKVQILVENDMENSSCYLSEFSNDITCKESIDFKYLRRMEERQIRSLTVESYNRMGIMKKVSTKEGLMKSSMDNFVAELHFKDISVRMSTTVDFQILSGKKYSIEGEIFSNRIVKVGWKYHGYAILTSSNDNLTIEILLESREYENKWKLEGIMKIDGNNGKFHGHITHEMMIGVPEALRYNGSFIVNNTEGIRMISGEIEIMDLNVIGYFIGKMTKYIAAEITIPKGAFSGMNIENLIFKNSYFFGDFDTHSFEGINGLETIRFSQSKMEFMPAYNIIFRGPSLKAIYIEDSNTPTISVQSDCSAQLLELLSFKGSGFLEFSEKSFQWLTCSNLTFLNFHDTNFRLIGNGSFLTPISDTLKYLDISYSTLRHETNIRQFLNGTRITHLSLAGLQLKRVPTTALEMVKDTIEYLSLRRNNFEKIPGENFLINVMNFPKMSILRELDFHDCRINYIEKRAFDSLENLKNLDLSGNNLINLQDGWIEIKPKIIYLNLSDNGVITRALPINILDVKDPFDLGVFDELEILDLSNSDFWNHNRLILSKNIKLKYLSLCKSGLNKLNDSLFESMPYLEEIDLSDNPDLGRMISFDHFIKLKYLKKLHLANSGIINLTVNDNNDDDEIMNNLEYIDLSNNYIQTIRPELFKLISKLKILKLSHNSICYLSPNLLINLPHLKIIYLDNNKMESFKSTIIDTISRLNKISLGGNPFLCGCYILDFTKRIRKIDSDVYLCPDGIDETESRLMRMNQDDDINFLNEISNSTTRKVYLFRNGCAKIMDWSENEYQCYSPSNRRLVSFMDVTKDFEECQNDLEDDYFNWEYLMVTISLLFSFFIGFLWWKWWNFRLFTKIMKNAVILSFIEEGEYEKVSYEYDAFVSYTDKDRKWVTEELLPNLEKMKDVNICLHERDFQVGLSILENIGTSIDKSKCIILVLSQAFVKSRWCQYEMHLAYHRLLETRRDQMILILLENIPRYKRPRILQYLMMTKTYIQWPSNTTDKKDIEIFWNRLFRAIAYINHN